MVPWKGNKMPVSVGERVTRGKMMNNVYTFVAWGCLVIFGLSGMQWGSTYFTDTSGRSRLVEDKTNVEE